MERCSRTKRGSDREKQINRQTLVERYSRTKRGRDRVTKRLRQRKKIVH